MQHSSKNPPCFSTNVVLLEETYACQSNGYMFEDSLYLTWRDTAFDWKMLCMLQGLFVQRVSSFQKYCTKYAMEWVCAHVLNEAMHFCMLGKRATFSWQEELSGFKKGVTFCKGMLSIEKEYSFCLECYTLWLKMSVCNACSSIRIVSRERCMFDRLWQSFTMVSLPFSSLGKRQERSDFMWVECPVPTGHFLRNLGFMVPGSSTS